MSLDIAQLKQMYEPKQGATLTNTQQFCAARFSPCGTRLIAGGCDGLVHRWDCSADELKELAPLEGHGGWVAGPAFSPSGDCLYTADSWGQLRAWSHVAEPPTLKWALPAAHGSEQGGGWIRSIAISPDGARLATCASDGRVRLRSTADGALQYDWSDHAADVLVVAFHPDGKSLVSGDAKGQVKHWDLTTGTCARTLDAGVLFKLDRLQDVGGVRCLAFSPDGARLAAGGTLPANGGTVQGTPCMLVYNWASGALEQTLNSGQQVDVFVWDIAFHAAGFLMAVTNGNPGSGKLIFRRPEDPAPFFETTVMANCQSLSLHAAGRRLAIVATNTGSNGNGRNLDANGEYLGNWSPIHLWDLPG